MSKKKSEPAPQPMVSIPSAPTMSQNISEYINNYPRLFELEKQYAPLEAQLELDLLKQFGPEFTEYLTDSQKELTPYTYSLQEDLAKLASERMNGGLPGNLQNAYLDTLRSEIGPNAGSGIGGDYVSSNLVKLNEDYANYYKNLGLSLINRVPVNSISPATPNFSNPVGDYTFGNLASYNAGLYPTRVQSALSQNLLFPSYGGGGGSRFNFQGALGGGLAGAQAGSVFGPVGTAEGAILGGLGGGFF